LCVGQKVFTILCEALSRMKAKTNLLGVLNEDEEEEEEGGDLFLFC
jgi:hypothetical protein